MPPSAHRLMSKSWQIPRRTFLRGLGTAIALPMLDAMVPGVSLALRAAGASSSAPRRMAFVYVPNGANMSDWTPREIGTEFELPMILEPLKAHRQDFQVLTGLAHDKAKA